jgi:GT2 family glycosyltransferase
VIRQKNAGPAFARNVGASRASGDIILFTDSDCEPADGWLAEMLRPFEEDPVLAGVKGVYRTRQREIAARFVQYEYEDKYRKMARHRAINFIDTYSAGFKRSVFMEMGGYDTGFPVACAEDVELSYRMYARGFKMVFNPRAAVYHIHPSSLRNYMKKKYKFAYWRMLAVRKNPARAISDSHTPQTMKLQMVLAPLVAGAGASSAFAPGADTVFAAALLLILAAAAPFTARTMRRDPIVGLLSPGLLFARGVSQFLGVLGGGVSLLKNKA